MKTQRRVADTDRGTDAAEPLGPESLTWKYFGDLRTGISLLDRRADRRCGLVRGLFATFGQRGAHRIFGRVTAALDRRFAIAERFDPLAQRWLKP